MKTEITVEEFISLMESMKANGEDLVTSLAKVDDKFTESRLSGLAEMLNMAQEDTKKNKVKTDTFFTNGAKALRSQKKVSIVDVIAMMHICSSEQGANSLMMKMERSPFIKVLAEMEKFQAGKRFG